MLQSRILWSAIGSLLISGACYALADGEIIPWIDYLFMAGLVLLMGTGLYTVISGGFFDLFSRGFRALFQSKSDREYGGFDDPLPEDNDRPQNRSQRAKWFASIAFVTGLIVTALSYLLIFFQQ